VDERYLLDWSRHEKRNRRDSGIPDGHRGRRREQSRFRNCVTVFPRLALFEKRIKSRRTPAVFGSPYLMIARRSIPINTHPVKEYKEYSEKNLMFRGVIALFFPCADTRLIQIRDQRHLVKTELQSAQFPK
jgi:hypothetical protein